MAAQNQQQQQVPAIREEKFFRFRLEKSIELLQTAIEDALGVELLQLAVGMWTATIPVGNTAEMEITVRAIAVEDGTTVDVHIQHHTKPFAIGAFALFIIPASMLIVPLFWAIARGQKIARTRQRQRLVMLHKIWTEISAAVGAPKRASYRGAPQRVRVEESSAQEIEIPSEDDEQALAEA